jgi:DNA recombination-dependent growth factor C
MGPHIKLKKTEYLAINSKETDNLILEEGIVIKQVDYDKYLGTILNKIEGIGKEEIRNRIDQSKKLYLA